MSEPTSSSTVALHRHGNLIGGRWVPAEADATYSVFNPARPAECLGQFADSTRADAAAAVEAASAAAASWAEVPGPQRGEVLFRFAQLLEDSRDELGRIVTLEMGKALAEAGGEVGRAAAEARFMAGEASRPTGQTFPSERRGIACRTVADPIGVVAAICPWNFPVVAPVRKIAPALAWGNTVVFKPSSLTPWSAVYLTNLLTRAGVPAGVVNLVTGSGSVVGEALIQDRRVAGISFTGSTVVGGRIAAAAANRFARVQLEMGGKNPAVVVDCGDLEHAAREIVAAAFLCSGQRCTAISRVIVREAEADALVRQILACVERIRVGDGLEAQTTMGPLVSAGQLRTVHRFVEIGVESGCELLAGGRSLASDPERDGYFFAPTVFDRVPPDSPLALEEIFGPVLPIVRVAGFDEAVAAANSGEYGLAASIFTARPEHAEAFMRRIAVGMVHVNHGTASQAHVPFGGVKGSGYGAYSIGATAKEFYTSVKTVYEKW